LFGDPRTKSSLHAGFRALHRGAERVSEPRAVCAAVEGDRFEQRLDGEVGLGARQQRGGTVANDWIGKKHDEAGSSPPACARQCGKGAVAELLVLGASGLDQCLDCLVVLRGKLRERAQGTLLPQQSEGRPRIAELLGGSLAARLKDVYRRYRPIMVGVEGTDRVRDLRRTRRREYRPAPSRQQHDGR
jgi:hypothetical protein